MYIYIYITCYLKQHMFFVRCLMWNTLCKMRGSSMYQNSFWHLINWFVTLTVNIMTPGCGLTPWYSGKIAQWPPILQCHFCRTQYLWTRVLRKLTSYENVSTRLSELKCSSVHKNRVSMACCLLDKFDITQAQMFSFFILFFMHILRAFHSVRQG